MGSALRKQKYGIFYGIFQNIPLKKKSEYLKYEISNSPSCMVLAEGKKKKK